MYLAILLLTVLATAVAVASLPRSCPAALRVGITHTKGDALLVKGRVGRSRLDFLVDTGYAGPPVLSTALKGEDAFLREVGGVRFAVGCRVNVASLGVTKERLQAILLTPPIQLQGKDGYFSPKSCAGAPEADVLTSNPAVRSHILTLDFLLHAGPCLIDFAANTLSLRAARPRGAVPIALERDGGAFVAAVAVDGVNFRCVVDTGAPALMLNAPSAERSELAFTGSTGEKLHGGKRKAAVSVGGIPLGDADVVELDAPRRGEGVLGLDVLRRFRCLYLCSNGVYAVTRKVPV